MEEQTKLYKSDDCFKWYVLFTASNREYQIKDKILRQEDITVYVKQIYMPVNETYVLKKNTKVLQTELIFPCYIFILANLTAEVVHRIHLIDGVHCFLGLPTEQDRVSLDRLNRNHLPKPLTDEEVYHLVQATRQIQSTKNSVGHKYEINDYVCITSGIFRNLKGYVKEIRNSLVILEVEEIINRSSVSVTIPINEIERVN